MKFETELPRYYISQMDTIDGRGYIRLLPYGPFETPEEEQCTLQIYTPHFLCNLIYPTF